MGIGTGMDAERNPSARTRMQATDWRGLPPGVRVAPAAPEGDRARVARPGGLHVRRGMRA